MWLKQIFSFFSAEFTMDNSYILDGDLLNGWDELYDNGTYDNLTGDCCDGGDICDLQEGIQFEAMFIPILYWVAFVVGILGNGVLLGVLFRSRKKWSVTDTFILHLGVADILLLLTLPLWAAQSAQKKGWTFGTPLCMITGSMFTVRRVCIKVHDSKYVVVEKKIFNFLFG